MCHLRTRVIPVHVCVYVCMHQVCTVGRVCHVCMHVAYGSNMCMYHRLCNVTMMTAEHVHSTQEGYNVGGGHVLRCVCVSTRVIWFECVAL
jgi:hypothetical protein